MCTSLHQTTGCSSLYMCQIYKLCVICMQQHCLLTSSSYVPRERLEYPNKRAILVAIATWAFEIPTEPYSTIVGGKRARIAGR